MGKIDIAIVLTGTIIPNDPSSVHADPQVRRSEYLRALHYYSQFVPVYFLENSSYPLSADPDFQQMTNVKIVKLPLSPTPEMGKGYQEFEMLDRWILSDPSPPLKWIKITGRYIYRNIGDLLQACRKSQAELTIDQCCLTKMARSYLFCVSSEFYLRYFFSVFRLCDDRKGEWIEKVLFRRIKEAPRGNVQLFSLEPDLTGISGSTGGSLEVPRLKFRVKQRLRAVNRLLDRQYLWYAR